MSILLELKGATIDSVLLKLAAERYKEFTKVDRYDESYKWEILQEINQWYKENEISEDNVYDYIKYLQKMNPQAGSFTHWSDLDHLNKFAEDEPEKAASMIRELYHGDGSIGERIDVFRDTLNEEEGFTIGTPTFGYLFASLNKDEYPIYKDGVFMGFIKDFLDNTDFKKPGMSIGDKYGSFIELCHLLRDHLLKEDAIPEPSALYSQDLMYCVERYPEIHKEDIFLRYIFMFSKRLNDLKGDTDELISSLKELPEPFLKSQLDKYEGTEKIKLIRYHVLEKILNGESLDLEEIKAKVSGKYETNILHSWTDFTILGQIYFDYFKTRLDGYFEHLGEYLVENIDIDDLEHHIVTFLGVRNFVTEKPWILIYPEEKGDHRDSYQLFLRMFPDKLEYGLSHGENIDNSEFFEKYVHGVSEFDEMYMAEIVSRFNDIKQEFIDLNGLKTPIDVDEDVMKLVERYKELRDLEGMLNYVGRTSKVVRTICEHIVQKGHIDKDDMKNLFNMWLDPNTASSSRKISSLNHFGLDDDVHGELEGLINEGIGIVGTGSYEFFIPSEKLEEMFRVLKVLTASQKREELDKAISGLIDLELSGIQSGKISPLFYFLHPTKYPIINSMSKEGVKEHFGYNISSKLADYLDEIKRFELIRDAYGFHENYRDLDHFFLASVGDEKFLDEPGVFIKNDFSHQGNFNIWQMSPGKVRDDFWPIFVENGIASFGWENGRDLIGMSKEEIASKMGKEPDSNDVICCYNFANIMKEGDILVAKKGNSKEIYGIGAVKSGYYHDPKKGEELFGHINKGYYSHFRDVEWIIAFDERMEVDIDTQFVQYTLEKLDEERYEKIKANLIEKNTELRTKFHELEGLPVTSDGGYEFAMEEILDRVFINRKDAEDARKYFQKTLEYIGDPEQLKHLISTTYDSTNNKLAVNFGPWWVFSISRRGDGYFAHLAVDMSVLPEDYNDWPDVVRKTKGSFHAHEDVGLLGIVWDPKLFERRPVLERSWRSALSIAREKFSDWKGASPIQYHREYIYRWIASEREVMDHEDIQRTIANSNRIKQINDGKLDFKNFDVTKGLYFPPNMRDEINHSLRAALGSGKNIILTGPPGTGKTKIAKKTVEFMKENCGDCVDGFIFTTATADWTTFDTIGGYHPEKEGRSLAFKPGLFLRCFRNREGVPVNKWLIIDEINRADIDKAFGQLFSVLSKDDVELPFTTDEGDAIRVISMKDRLDNYSDNDYYVTKNWRLLATMNTYDKASLYEMSYAFMRRFAFVDVSVPSDEITEGLIGKYIGVWEDIELNNVKSSLGTIKGIWSAMNEGKRAIGPAIIRDILLFIQESNNGKIVPALKLYVLPQLEGMVRADQADIINGILKHIDDADEKESLKRVSKERFELREGDFKESK